MPLPPRLRPWLKFAAESGRKHGVDAFLVLAVMDVESLGGEALTPKGPGGTGDQGNALGLMQIDKRYHKAFAAERLSDGTPAWADPARNIDYGTALLRERIALFNGSEPRAAASYNASVKRVVEATLNVPPDSPEALIKAADSVTKTGHYVRDVLDRRDKFKRALSAPIP